MTVLHGCDCSSMQVSVHTRWVTVWAIHNQHPKTSLASLPFTVQLYNQQTGVSHARQNAVQQCLLLSVVSPQAVPLLPAEPHHLPPCCL